MPLQPDELLAYRAACTGAAFRDLDRERARTRIRGPDLVRFLQGLCTNDIAALATGEGCRAAILDVKGHVMGVVHVLRQEEGLLVESEAACGARARDVLQRHAIVDDVEIEAADELGEIGVYGPRAADVVARALAADRRVVPEGRYRHTALGETLLVATPELGPGGYWIMAPAQTLGRVRASVAADAAWLPDATSEALRLEAGTARYGLDIDEGRLPIEAGLDDAISYTKGCYMGQEVVARVTARGQVNRRLVRLAVTGDRLPSEGDRVSTEGRDDAGWITSAAFCPGAQSVLAFAYLHRTVWETGRAVVVRLGDGVEVQAAVRHGGSPAS